MTTPGASDDDNQPEPASGPPAGGGVAFLLAQLGAHAAARFADRIADIGLTPPQAGVLRAVVQGAGSSQQQVATVLGVLPSSMVSLVDDLERRGLLRRERSSADRRQYTLRLTPEGEEVMQRLAQLAREHERDVCASIDDRERSRLLELLARVRDQQGLVPGVHPGYRQGPARTDHGPAATPRRS